MHSETQATEEFTKGRSMKSLFRKLFILAALMAAILVSGTAAYADNPVCPEGVTVKKLAGDKGKITISGISEIDSDLTASIEEYIDEKYEDGLDITDIEIGQDVENIGESAFECWEFENLVIGDGVESIGNKAFASCGTLKTVTFGSGLKHIGDEAFNCCSALETISNMDVVESIGKDAFCECSALEEVIIPDSVSTIGTDAFGFCEGLKKVVIGDGVKNISSVFCGCVALEEVEIGSSVETIDSAFTGTGLKKVEIPDSVTSMDGAFNGCENLEEVKMPSELENFGEGTFNGCKKLGSIIIPDGVEEIGNDSFMDCTSLSTVVLPDSLKKIGESAFYIDKDESSLTDIYYKGTWDQWKEIDIPGNNNVLTYYDEEANEGWGDDFIIGTYTTKLPGDTVRFHKISDSRLDRHGNTVGNVLVHYNYNSDNQDISVEGVSLNKTSENVDVGGEIELQASVTPENSTNKEVIWESSDESVAEVSSSGVVTGISEGTADIIVSTLDGYFEAKCTITVSKSKVSVSSVKLNAENVEIDIDENVTLEATVEPNNASNKNLAWKSSDTKVAVVTSTGVVTGKGAGTATITVTTEDGNKTASCKVTVKKAATIVSGVKLDTSSTSIEKGKAVTLTATVLPEDAANKNVSWKSSNTKAATIVQNGNKCVVTGIAAGTADITVTTEDGNKTATCKVKVTDPVVPVTGVKLNATSAGIAVGKTLTLTPTVAPSNATNKAVTWKSSNTKIATVTSAGIVKGIAAGTANITVTTTDGKKAAVCKVTVTIPVSSVKLNKTSASVVKGYTITLKPTINPSNATNKKVTWKSSNTKIATVTSAGVVKGIAKGTANITVTTTDGKKTAVCKVTVTNPIAVKSVKLSKTSASVVKGYTITLKPTINPSNATNKKVTWKSSNTKIATVTSAGVVKGVRAGTANITVITADGKKTAVCKVKVTNPVAVKSIKLNKTSVSIAKGKTYTLQATITPSNATNKTVTWKSSNTKIATVSSKGVVKGVKAGTVTITAVTKDGSKKASCKVTVR